MTDYDDLTYRDASMLHLFCTEVETQVALLNEGLLALERDPHTLSVLTSLMRAAHSIKGAARVVDLGTAEQIAHAMEDCFVAAQEGKLRISGEPLEVLLRASDLLLQVAHHAAAAPGDGAQVAECALLVETLSTLASTAHQARPGPAISTLPVLAGDVPSSSAVLPGASLSTLDVPTAAQGASAEPRGPSRTVRVTVEHLNRLLSLAGAALVEVRWLQPFAASLLQLKSKQVALAADLDKLRESLQGVDIPSRLEDYLRTARHQAATCRQLLADRLTELELFAQRSENLADRLYHAAIASHMRPFEDGVQGLPRMVHDLARQLGKQARLDINGRTTEVDRDILERLEAPLSHLLRNALDHGIETPAERLAAGKPAEGTIRLEARHHAGMLSITVTDDGRGVDGAWLRQTIVAKNLVTADVAAELTDSEVLEFLFLPTFSTAATVTAISGRGVGLDVVQSMTRAVGGMVRAVSRPGQGMSFHLQLPLTLSVIRALVVEIAGEPYAFPLARIERVLVLPAAQVDLTQEQQYITIDERQIRLVLAHQVLEVPAVPTSAETLSIVVVSDRSACYGLIVDRFLSETDLVVQPLDARLGKIPDISAAALLEDGAPVLIIDVEDIVRSAENILTGRRVRQRRTTVHTPAASPRQRVLVVDDSLTVREAARRLLTQNGYDVEVAVDGMDGWNAVRAGHYDLVITDMDMPRLDGAELIRLIRQDPHLQGLPIIIVSYKGREADRLQGLAAGAQTYMTKNDFHEMTFIQNVQALLDVSADGGA